MEKVGAPGEEQVGAPGKWLGARIASPLPFLSSVQ
jgi:hypothetical protein